MRIPGRRIPLPDRWADALAEHLTRRSTVLAWSPMLTPGGTEGICVALPDALLLGTRNVGDAEPTSGTGRPPAASPARWQRIGWHEVESGGWNVDDRQLVWVLTSRRRGSVNLVKPGNLPAVFRERVAATFVLKQHLPVDGTRNGVTISARRDLADPTGPLIWSPSPGKGTRMNDPDVAAVTERAVAQLQTEYDFR